MDGELKTPRAERPEKLRSSYSRALHENVDPEHSLVFCKPRDRCALCHRSGYSRWICVWLWSVLVSQWTSEHLGETLAEVLREILDGFLHGWANIETTLGGVGSRVMVCVQVLVGKGPVI